MRGALRDGKALLAEIPTAARRGARWSTSAAPTASSQGSAVSPDFWLKAKVACTTDGVPSHVEYREYRDEDAYTAAYDPVSLLQYADDDDPTCPGGYEAAWKVDDHEVGRVACSLHSDEAHMTWTYDPQSIVADGVTLDQESTAPMGLVADLGDRWSSRRGPSHPGPHRQPARRRST